MNKKYSARYYLWVVGQVICYFIKRKFVMDVEKCNDQKQLFWKLFDELDLNLINELSWTVVDQDRITEKLYFTREKLQTELTWLELLIDCVLLEKEESFLYEEVDYFQDRIAMQVQFSGLNLS